jgi:hypothetical protein
METAARLSPLGFRRATANCDLTNQFLGATVMVFGGMLDAPPNGA